MEHEIDGNVGVVSFPQGVAGEVRWKGEPSWLPPTCLRSPLQGKVGRGAYEVDGNVGVVFPQGVAKGKKKKKKKGTQKLCSGDGCPNKANARDGSAIIVPESRGRSKAAPPRCKHEAGRKARRSRCGRNCSS